MYAVLVDDVTAVFIERDPFMQTFKMFIERGPFKIGVS